MLLLLLVIYLLLFSFLIATTYVERIKRYRPLAKTATSLVFIAVAIYGFVVTGDSGFFYSMIPALVFCLFGDIFLSLPSADDTGWAFYAGVGSFAAAHILFLIAFWKLAPFSLYELIFPIVLVIVVFILTKIMDFDFGNNVILVIVLIYGFLVAWTFSRSVAVFFYMGMGERTLALLAGSFLFMLSDIFLLFIYFYKKKFQWMPFVNLACYYSGMFLLALSISFT